MQFSGCELKQTTIKACYCTWSSTCKKFAFFFASEQKINKSLNRDWSQNISWSFLPWQLCSFWVEHDYKVKLDTVVQVVNSFFCFEHNLSECNVIKKLVCVLALHISSYGCTWEVWRTLKKQFSSAIQTPCMHP